MSSRFSPLPAPRPPVPRSVSGPSFSATPAPRSVALHPIFGPWRSVFRSGQALTLRSHALCWQYIRQELRLFTYYLWTVTPEVVSCHRCLVCLLFEVRFCKRNRYNSSWRFSVTLCCVRHIIHILYMLTLSKVFWALHNLYCLAIAMSAFHRTTVVSATDDFGHVCTAKSATVNFRRSTCIASAILAYVKYVKCKTEATEYISHVEIWKIKPQM